MPEITQEEAYKRCPSLHINWRKGSLLLLKVAGYHRIGMIHAFTLEHDAVNVRFLMIDTVLACLDGGRAWGTFAPDVILRYAETADIFALFNSNIVLPPKEELISK